MKKEKEGEIVIYRSIDKTIYRFYIFFLSFNIFTPTRKVEKKIIK